METMKYYQFMADTQEEAVALAGKHIQAEQLKEYQLKVCTETYTTKDGEKTFCIAILAIDSMANALEQLKEFAERMQR